MAAVLIPSNAPKYLALSTDIADNKIIGCSYAGALVYLTDTKVWKTVKEDLTLADYVIETSATLEVGDIEIGAVEIKNSTTDDRLKINTDGSINTLTWTGSATGGTKTTIVDTNKNFTTNMLANKLVQVVIGNKSYYRVIASNTADTITIPVLEGAAASAIIGAGENGVVTITAANDGIGGNSYTVQAVQATDPDINLSAVLVGLALTVTLGTDGAGAPDITKNTATLVAGAIDTLEQFTAVASGTGATIVSAGSVVLFTGGIAIVTPSSGSLYNITL